MHFNNMKDFLDSIRLFMKNNPTAFLQRADEPKQLRVGFEAVTDTPNNDGTKWTISIIKFKEVEGILNLQEQKIVKKHYTTSVAYSKAEAKYINMIAGMQVRN